MANTLKFGNGKWGAKKDSILAYNDENANFKPLPFTTSRASTATRINKAGLIEKVENGIPRVDYLGNTKGAMLLEPQSTNLIRYSEAFANSYWTKSGATIQGDPSTAGSELVTNGSFTGSATGWTLGLGWSYGTNNLTVSSSTANLSQSGIVSVNKLYLVSYEISGYVSGSVNSNVGGIVTGRLGNSNQIVSEYIYTSSVVNDIFYITANSFTGSIDNVSVKEVKGFASPSSDTPLGALKLVESNSSAIHYIKTPNITVTNSTNHTMCFFAKKGERNIAVRDGSSDAFVSIDLTNNLVLDSLGISTSIELIGNGWYKISVSYLSSSTICAFQLITLSPSYTSGSPWSSYTGDGTSGVYIFGAQLEQKSYATSYIPNYGESAGVTRLVDTCFNQPPIGVIGQTELTVFYQGIVNVQTGLDGHAIALSQSADAAGSSRILLFRKNSDNNMYVFIQNSIGQFDTPLLVGTPSSENDRYAIIIKNSILKVYFNGQKVIDKTNGTIPLMQYLYLNEWSDQNRHKNRIKNVKLYNTVLSDSEAIALTSN